MQRRGLRLREERDAQPLRGERAAEEVLLVLAPGRGVGDADPVGGAALAFRDAVDDPAQQARGELLGGDRPAAEHHGRRVADAPLELADDAVRVGQRAPLGRLADDHAPVGRDEQY
ncbi:hypothetical protein BJF78_29310 [Pseudonocardia sp. CNS-139]|nr:hypothetical protein BJF78_29310 [Pseudonocardia sp. CNS-139]